MIESLMSKSDFQVNNFGFIIRLIDCMSLLINSINRGPNIVDRRSKNNYNIRVNFRG